MSDASRAAATLLTADGNQGGFFGSVILAPASESMAEMAFQPAFLGFEQSL
jgi:hypothetical protein